MGQRSLPQQRSSAGSACCGIPFPSSCLLTPWACSLLATGSQVGGLVTRCALPLDPRKVGLAPGRQGEGTLCLPPGSPSSEAHNVLSSRTGGREGPRPSGGRGTPVPCCDHSTLVHHAPTSSRNLSITIAPQIQMVSTVAPPPPQVGDGAGITPIALQPPCPFCPCVSPRLLSASCWPPCSSLAPLPPSSLSTQL